MKINEQNNRFRWIFKAGFFIILALPIFNLPPWLYPPDWGKAMVFRSILAILLFLLVWSKLRDNKAPSTRFLFKNPLILAMITLFSVFFLASIFSADAYFSFWGSPYRGGGFVNLAFYFVFAVLTFLLFKKEDWQKAWIFSDIIGILVCAIGLSQYYGLFHNIFVSVQSRPGSTIGNPIFLGIYLLLLFFPTLSFAIKEKNKKLKIFYVFSLLLFLYTILITGSRAAYLGFIAGILYFMMFYPRKLKLIKISIAAFLVIIGSVVFYANNFTISPQALEQNRILQILDQRLSIKKALSDERYQAWKTVFNEIKDRPILGWGPENLSIGFDKFYDPNITVSPWWDKAHNIILDIGAQTGISGILSYLALFAVLFWQTQIARKKAEDENKKIIINGIQAVLAGYLVANFFSFDSTSSYLIFFFIIGYSLYLVEQNNIQDVQESAQVRVNLWKKWKNQITVISAIILLIFLYQYNLVPFIVNTKINIANNWAQQQEKCDASLSLMEKLATQHSFIDSYLRTQYVDNLKFCSGINSNKNLEYAQKGLVALQEAVKIQPLYTRFWIYLGSFTTVIANNEQNPQTKQNLINQAYSYFDKAEKLAPLHQGIFIERTTIDMVAENYLEMKQDAQKCIDIKPNIGNCYWLRALAELYMDNQSNAEKDTLLAEEHKFNTKSTEAYYQLVSVYIKKGLYAKVASTYEKLIQMHPDETPGANPNKNPKAYFDVAQYHASLAFAYSKLGQYQKARQQALIFLEMMPEAKDEVEAFLKTLPY